VGRPDLDRRPSRHRRVRRPGEDAARALDRTPEGPGSLLARGPRTRQNAMTGGGDHGHRRSRPGPQGQFRRCAGIGRGHGGPGAKPRGQTPSIAARSLDVVVDNDRRPPTPDRVPTQERPTGAPAPTADGLEDHPSHVPLALPPLSDYDTLALQSPRRCRARALIRTKIVSAQFDGRACLGPDHWGDSRVLLVLQMIPSAATADRCTRSPFKFQPLTDSPSRLASSHVPGTSPRSNQPGPCVVVAVDANAGDHAGPFRPQPGPGVSMGQRLRGLV
jgi:hypothetical protein